MVGCGDLEQPVRRNRVEDVLREHVPREHGRPVGHDQEEQGLKQVTQNSKLYSVTSIKSKPGLAWEGEYR